MELEISLEDVKKISIAELMERLSVDVKGLSDYEAKKDLNTG